MPAPSSTIPEFRLQWAGRFIDTVTFTRAATRGTFNETTGVYEIATPDAVYSGVCLVRPSGDAKAVDYGEESVTTILLDIFVPHDAGTFDIEDTGVIDAAIWNPDLVGRILTVVDIDVDSYHTRQRVRCLVNLGEGFNG